MSKFASVVVLLAVWIWSSTTATHSPVKDPKTQAFIGEKDDIANTGDDRIIISIPDGNVTFGKDGNFSVTLGVEEWGPIQVSALLTTYPDLESETKNATLCKIQNNGEDPIIMNSTNSIRQLNVTASRMIAQSGIVYIFSDNSNKVYGAVFSLAKDRSSFNFTIVNNFTITELSAGDFASATIISDTYNSQLIMFKGTNVYYINTQATRQDVKVAPSYTTDAFSLSLYGDIRYMDAYLGTMVVLTTDELALYTLSPGTIGGGRFVIDGDFNMVDGVLDLRDFELNPDRTQMYNTVSSFATSKIWPYQNYFYNFSISLSSQITSISTQRITSNLFFVADSARVHVFDFSLLKTDVTKGKLPHPIDISNVISVRRYKESLYLLRTTSSDLDSPAVEVVEVFLLANSVTSWSDPDATGESLYYVNNVFITDFNVTEIYLDDTYVYMQGTDKIAVAYRGKPSKYSTSQAVIFHGIPHDGIGDIAKILVDGFGMYFALLDSKPTVFNMSLAMINVTCPVDHDNGNFGDYIIQINTTTSTCPKKKQLLSTTLDVKGTLEKACVLQKNLKVVYEGTRAVKVTPTNSTADGTSSKDAESADAAARRIMYWFYGALAIFVVLVVAGIIYLVARRKNLKVNPTATVEVIEKIEQQGQAGVYEIKRIAHGHSESDISPSERVLKGPGYPEQDYEAPLKKKGSSTSNSLKRNNKIE